MARTGARKPSERAAEEAAARRAAATRRLRNRRIITGAVIAAVLIGAVVFFATRPPPPALANVQTFPDLGQAHLVANEPAPEYNSNPPTSGPHAPSPALCGIYRQPVSDIAQVHDLEHGVVVVQYDPAISDEQRDQLEQFGRDAPSHVIVAPREGMDATIAVTAWTKLMTMDTADLEAIEAFYGQFAQAGPEAGIQCPFSVDEGA
ncbi:MAG: DUF3105 domain-containing protein [Acidimicrobiia bacterium]